MSTQRPRAAWICGSFTLAEDGGAPLATPEAQSVEAAFFTRDVRSSGQYDACGAALRAAANF